MSDLNEKLLPCPFCGGTDAFVERADYSAAYVQCDSDVGDGCSCQARGPIAVQDDDGEEIPGGAGAIRNWNRRAALAAPAVQVEPVAEVRMYHSTGLGVMWLGDGRRPAIGTKLYAAPVAAPADPAGWLIVTGHGAHFRDTPPPDTEFARNWRAVFYAAPAAQPTLPDDERAAFEKWMREENGALDCDMVLNSRGGWADDHTANMYIGWQARAALRQPCPLPSLKDHEIAQLVNTLRDTAIAFHDAQQLRARIAAVLVPILKRPGALPDDAENAARWRELMRQHNAENTEGMLVVEWPGYKNGYDFVEDPAAKINQCIAARAAAAKEKPQ